MAIRVLNANMLPSSPLMSPLRPSDERHQHKASRGREQHMTREILIVDDEPGVAVAIQFLMEQQGHRVLVAQRGEDALDLIYKYKPDLVLLDIMLPGISGWEVCEIIRLNPDYRNVKIVFLTARRAEVEIAKGLALGADAYITKPFSNDRLVAKVNALLESAFEAAGK
jgi:DNA-binding response OmpR family regulator